MDKVTQHRDPGFHRIGTPPPLGHRATKNVALPTLRDDATRRLRAAVALMLSSALVLLKT